MDIQVDTRGLVGPQIGADGSRQQYRQGKTGSLVTTDAHGRYHEASSRGALLIASTAVGGVAPGTALGTTPPMALWNPTGSGIILSIVRVVLGYVSGTLGAGSMVHAQVPAGVQPAAPTSGTELVPVPGSLNTSKGIARAFQGSTVAATPTIVRPSFIIGAALASSVAFPALAVDEVAGEIIVPPGAAWVFQGVAAAGTSPLVMIGVTYEEIKTPT